MPVFHSSPISPFIFPPLFLISLSFSDPLLKLSFVPELCLRPVVRIASPRAYPNFCSGSEYFYSPLPCGGTVTSCTLNSDQAGQAQVLAEDIVLYSVQGPFFSMFLSLPMYIVTVQMGTGELKCWGMTLCTVFAYFYRNWDKPPPVGPLGMYPYLTFTWKSVTPSVKFSSTHWWLIHQIGESHCESIPKNTALWPFGFQDLNLDCSIQSL